MTLLPVIAHISKQHDKIKRLVAHCRQLDGTELLVIPVGPEIERLPYPAGAERVRHEVMRQLRNQPFLWLEADSIPFRAGWLQAISDEYARVDKPFLLPSLVGAPGCDFASGIGVYPADALRIIPQSFERQSWDGWIYKNLSHAIHFTRLIQHSYCYCENGKGVRKHSFPQDNGMLRGDAMIFHADPTQSLITAGCINPPAEQSFYHSGDFGDVIAALPVIRHKGGGALYLGPHLHEGLSPRQGINRARFEDIFPLLKGQSYLTKIDYLDCPPAGAIDFSSFRNTTQLPAENLTAWQARAIGIEEEIDMSPWLLVPSALNNRIAVSRSLRYQTPNFPWKQILHKHGTELLFIGLPEEHQAFQAQVGRIEYQRTPDLAAAAKLIAGCKFAFMNQSAPFWIAAGLGKNVIQETDVSELNSVIARPGILCTSTPAELQHVIDCSR